MRLLQHDATTIHERQTLVLRGGASPIKIEVQALPPDFDDRAEEELPTPRPPRLGWEKEKGKVLLDTQNRPVPRLDDDDPDYLRARRANNKLQIIRTIVAGLAPDQMEFEAKYDAGDPRGYYTAVLKEMKAFGFGFGDIVRLAKEISELSGITEGEIKVAEEDFLDEEG